MNLKLLLDLSPISIDKQSRTGLARYSYDLYKVISKTKAFNKISVIANGSVAASRNLIEVSKVEKWNYVGYPLPMLFRSPKNFYLSPKLEQAYNVIRPSITQTSAREYNIFHSTYARIKPDIRKYFRNKHILTVHDLTPLILDKELFHPNQKAITSRIVKSIRPEDNIIAVSENTKSDLCNFVNIHPDKVKVIHNYYDDKIFYRADTSSLKKIKSDYSLPKDVPYFLTLSALGPHKNITTALKAVYILNEEHPKEAFKLLISGKLNKYILNLLKSYNTKFIEKRIVLTDFVEDHHLAALYSGARGFIFPSLYEGFGLPLIEAMACGCPVVYARNSSLSEIAGNVGFACDTFNVEQYSYSLKSLLLDDSSYANQELLSTKRAQSFTQEEYLTKMMNYYNEVAKF